MSTGSRVAVIGASGQLGSDLVEELARLGFECFTPSRADLDVCDHRQSSSVLRSAKPTVIINLASFHKVDACESDPGRAFAVNSLAVRNLAEVADYLEALLVHISTDYVFGGDQLMPYGEQAAPHPLQVYGVSKLAGEYLVRQRSRRHLVIRTSGLYGTRGNSNKGLNFVETILERGRLGPVKVVTDQVLSPTNTRDLSEMIVRLILSNVTGLIHVTNSGSCSWYDFAERISVLSGRRLEVVPVITDTMQSRVQRPRYSVLDNARLRAEGFGLLRSWQDAVGAYLDARSESLAQTWSTARA
jgi:dTDP-4-dehydrorhamnose reductase